MSRLNSPDVTKVSKFFTDPLYQHLKIPHFQRGYVWSRDQAETFWTDFLDTEAQKNKSLNLIGSIILCKTNDEEGQYAIVDGQQRLITVSLFIAALRDVWLEIIGRHEFADKFMNDQLFSVDPYTERKSLKIEVSHDIKNEYERIILQKSRQKNVSDESKSLFKVYEYFYQQIDEYISKIIM